MFGRQPETHPTVARTFSRGQAAMRSRDRWCRRRQVFEVVEDERQFPGAQDLPQPVGDWPAGDLADAQGPGDRAEDERGVADRRQRDEDDVGNDVVELGRRREGDARFADPAGAGQGEQAHVGTAQERGNLSNVVRATNEGRRRGRQGRELDGDRGERTARWGGDEAPRRRTRHRGCVPVGQIPVERRLGDPVGAALLTAGRWPRLIARRIVRSLTPSASASSRADRTPDSAPVSGLCPVRSRSRAMS